MVCFFWHSKKQLFEMGTLQIVMIQLREVTCLKNMEVMKLTIAFK